MNSNPVPNTHRGSDVRAEIYLYLTGSCRLTKEEALVFIERFYPLASGTFKNGGDYCRKGHLYDGYTQPTYRVNTRGERIKYMVRVCRQCKRGWDATYKRKKRHEDRIAGPTENLRTAQSA